jgi:hypothetical protein
VKDKFGFVGLKELTAVSKEHHPDVVEGLICEVGLSSWNAKPASCKSTCLRQLAVSVATGTPFMGRWEVKEAGSVFYYVLDDPRFPFAKTMTALNPTEDIRYWFGAIGMTRKEQLKNLGSAIKAQNKTGLPVKLVIIDTLVKFLQVTKDGVYGMMTPAMQEFSTLAEECKVHIAFSHHLRKREADSVGDTMMASTAIRAECEMNVFFTVDKNGTRIMSNERHFGDAMPETALVYDKATKTNTVGLPIEETEQAEAEDKALKEQGGLYAIVLDSEGCTQDHIFQSLKGSNQRKKKMLEEAIENEVIFCARAHPKKPVSKSNPLRHYTKLPTMTVN